MPSVEMTDGVQFEVSFHQQNASGEPSTVIKMDRTQYLVSVQGKTGERVRRTQAYIGGMSNDAVVPTWSASVKSGIKKCGTGATQTTTDCTPLSDAEVKRTYSNTTDYFICTHHYLTKDSDGIDTKFSPSSCSK
jgi:hypothetical protein